MPIPRSDFDRGETDGSLDRRIVDFLASHRESAFTAAEIAREIEHPSARSTHTARVPEVAEAVRLVERGGFEIYLGLLAFRGKIAGRLVRSGAGFQWYYSHRA